MRRVWMAAVAAVVLYFLMGLALQAGAGLTRTVLAGTPSHDVLEVTRDATIGPRDRMPRSAEGTVVVWNGGWRVDGGAYDLALDSDSEVSWAIDDVAAVQVSSGRVIRTVLLDRGFHRIEVRWVATAASRRLVVATAPVGQSPGPLPPESLTPDLPRHPWLRSSAMCARTAIGWGVLLAAVGILRQILISTRQRVWPRLQQIAEESSRGTLVRYVAWGALAVILLHGTLLRLDAIAGRFDVAPYPAWLQVIEARSLLPPASIRPATVTWSPQPLYPHRDGPPTHYHSDPYTYLQAARAMTSFYTAHFREPVFPFATKISLAVLGNQDTAVSYASTAFSVLAIWLTYVLGAALWSRPVGLAAACAVSLDRDTFSLASLGWRDDAYMAAFVLCAYLMLRYLRTAESPRVHRIGRWRVRGIHLEALLLGIGVGLTILTRIMAVTFVLGGMGWIFVTHLRAWRQHAIGLGIAALTATLIAAPYFVNCWRVYGDPLYTFNVHGAIYSVSEGNRSFEGSTAEYVREKVARRPMEALETIARGVTTYPFLNKFHGLNVWHPGIDGILAPLSLAGLVVLAAWPAGRLLLVIMATGLLPFSLTWTIDPDYRFTLFVYPVLLISAACAAAAAVRLMSTGAADLRRWLRAFAWQPWIRVLGTAALGGWFIVVIGPTLVAVEALRAGNDVSLNAGATDVAFFRSGWSEVVGAANVRSRVVRDAATLRLPLPGVAEYRATVRMDPFPRPAGPGTGKLPTIQFTLNGTPIATTPLTWSADRVGAYDITLPQSAVRAGVNDLEVRVMRPGADQTRTPSEQPGLTEGDAAAVWYFRLHPMPR